MKLTNGFWQTYKENPADAEIASHQLAIRAGLIQKATGGIYNYLPMGLRVLRKISNIIRDEHDKVDCYELEMSVITPAEIWKESGRWDVFGAEMLKIEARGGREFCVSPTNEEAIVDVFRNTVSSYKQLPVTLYQINTKYRDEIRPRYGLLRCREFVMKDAYSFHVDHNSLDKTYEEMFQVYSNILDRIGLRFIAVEADGGAMASGKAKTHEFQVLAPDGEDQIIHCPACGYAANIEKASTIPQGRPEVTSEATLEKVSTPNKKTIEEVSEFLKVRTSQVLKSVMFEVIVGEESSFVLAIVNGEDSLNEVKLTALLSCDHLRPVTSRQFDELGIPEGYIGAHGISKEIKVYFDQSITMDAAYVTGALEVDAHYQNFVPSRDTTVSYEVVDLRQSRAGDLCQNCQKEVEEIKGIEVGHIFQLGDKYTKSMEVSIQDQNGRDAFPLMGCYGIGVSRLIAATIEQHHDEKGIIWPVAIAPYQIHLVAIAKSDEFKAKCDELYQQLKAIGFEVLFDDRKAGPGFKFKDAELLGLPVQVVMGERDFNETQEAELRIRRSGEKLKSSLEGLPALLTELLTQKLK